MLASNFLINHLFVSSTEIGKYKVCHSLIFSSFSVFPTKECYSGMLKFLPVVSFKF